MLRKPELVAHLPLSITRGRLAAFVVIAVVALLTGATVAILPVAAVALGGIALIAGVAALNLTATERRLTLILFAGAVLLGYGFANLGLSGSLPLPLTEILLGPLVAIALTRPETRLPLRILVPLFLFVYLVAVRLVFDYPVWGIFAIRDTTTAIEAFLIAVGYRAVVRDGVEYWIGRLRWIMGAALIYGIAYPWRTQLAGSSPTVGLQRPTALLDPRGVKFTVVAACLYFVVFGRGWVRTLAIGLCIGELAVFQARTLYVLFPVAIILVGWAMRRVGRVMTYLAPALLIGGLMLAWASTFSIEGRRGPVTTSFIEAHASTLLGDQGPMAGSIQGRKTWFQLTVDDVTRSPGTILVGVGLGPDLTFGMLQGKAGQLVRKPHDDYLEVFAREGIIGLVLFLTIILGCLIPTARRARSGSGVQERFCAWAFASAVVYLGVAGAQPLLSFPYGSVPTFLILGMGLAAARSPRRVQETVNHGRLTGAGASPLPV